MASLVVRMGLAGSRSFPFVNGASQRLPIYWSCRNRSLLNAGGQKFLQSCSHRYNSQAAHKYIPRRALLYIPGNDERKIQKIPSLNVDCAVLDCEDGVALNKKGKAAATSKVTDIIGRSNNEGGGQQWWLIGKIPVDARTQILKTLDELDFGHAERCVRINAVSSSLAREDLEVILQARSLPSSLMLPKVENAEEIKWLAETFSRYSQGRTLQDPIHLITFVETAIGLLNFKDVCEEALRIGPQVGLHLDGVVFGAEDFRASIGATSSKETQELLYARQHIIVVAKAFGLQAIDLVYIDYRDGAGLAKQSREGALMGFTGKQVIHPNQIPIVQEQFTPSAERIQWAHKLISAFQEHQELGKGAFTFRGSMIDLPLLKQAQNLVTLATAIKKK
ncbi:citramalyl-CoA lyase, mitochondrial isoform X1 [Pleurodeles waltl]|uniref:citramalyl-CoA lyase, mitochondrial isoform X1 n=1 Tax=Pleurodeles waltl TaxID=8319 RepID=UPI0037095902